MHSAPIQAFWWPAENFGDCLTETLCAHQGLRVQHARPHFAQLIGVGSILERVPESFTGYVFGAGLLHEHTRRALPHARSLAVRGPLTWDRIGQPQNCVLGDPGLLARHLLAEVPRQRFKLGVVLHYADQQRGALEQLAARNPTEVRLIDVRRPPLEVIHAIATCEGIVSSSLHGLVVADALQIPSAWKWADEVLGQGFKFFDHAAAVHSSRKPLSFQGEQKLTTVLAQLSAPPPHALVVASELQQLLHELPQLLQCDPRRPRLPWLRYSVAKVQRLFRLKAA